MVRGRKEVVAVSPAVHERGGREGLTLAEVRALCPGVESLEHDPRGDRRAREAIGRWMGRFTPLVSVEWPKLPGEKDALIESPVIFLDLTGCERLFGGIDAIINKVREAVRSWRIRATMSVAPTPGAAWALAVCGGLSKPLKRREEIAAAVERLPVTALRVGEEVVKTLVDMGLMTIGQVMAMPRETLPSRFGKVLSLRLAQMVGEQLEPLEAVREEMPVEARVDWDAGEAGASSLDILSEVLQVLVGQIVADLQRRGRGARHLEMILQPAERRLAKVHRQVSLARPSRDPKRLLELLKCAAEKIEGSEWIEGFIGVRLKVPVHERVEDGQIRFEEEEGFEDAAAVEGLLERLRVKLGEGALVKPVRTGSWVPERAWRALRVGEKVAECVVPVVGDRPVYLLEKPAELRVLVEPHDYYAGQPVAFEYREESCRVVRSCGPERIGAEWWRGEMGTRDYYDVTDERGRRFWLFRKWEVVEGELSGRAWFLHGSFQ